MVKRVGWGDSIHGARGAKYSRFVDREKGEAGGVEFVDKHPNKNGEKKIYRRRGRILIPVGKETVHQNFHGNDSSQTRIFKNQFKRSQLASVRAKMAQGRR